ncbi:MAG: hypothetical protein J6M18_05080 [Actinomycetaceae bacterium]|nr:hypothetical protein [Actinomycetaceae bacterium]
MKSDFSGGNKADVRTTDAATFFTYENGIPYAYKPMVTFEGTLYGSIQDIGSLPDNASYITQVEKSYRKGIDVNVSDGNLVSNGYDEGAKIYRDMQGKLYIETNGKYELLEEILPDEYEE